MRETVRLPDVYKEIQDLDGSTSTVKFRANPDFFTAVTRRMRPYKQIPYHFKPAMEKVGDYVRTELIPRTFEAEGPGWAPLAPMTMGLRIAQGYPAAHPILIRSGDLFDELTQKSHPKHIEIIKTGKIARIEIGGSSQKFLENQMGGPRLPARPMIPGTGNIPMPDADRKRMKQIVMEELISRIDQSGRR